jgi:hypothetical protein
MKSFNLLLTFIFTFHLLISICANPSQNTESSGNSKPILILNALDNIGFDGASWFIESTGIFSASVGDIYLFHRGSVPSLSHINITSTIHMIAYDSTIMNSPLPDLRVAKKLKVTEHITPILYSWNYVLSQLPLNASTESSMILSLAFQKGAVPVLTNNFRTMNDMLTRNAHIDLFFLGKNKQLTSVSDWHDLILVAFKHSNPMVRQWLHTFQSIFLSYASHRAHYSMIDPRPALLEASARYQSKLRIGHFVNSEICSVASNYDGYFDIMKKNTLRDHDRRKIRKLVDHQFFREHHEKHHHFDSSRCNHIFTDPTGREFVATASAIQLFCGSDIVNPDREDAHTCLILDVQSIWKKKINRDPPLEIGELGACSNEDLLNDPIRMMWKGLLRFRNTSSPSNPRKFCWEDEANQHNETLAEARISQDPLKSWKQQTLFTHPDYEKIRSQKSNLSVIMVSGSEGSARKLDNMKYITMSKMAYAKRHGYSYTFVTSNEYYDYYPHDVFQGYNAPAMANPYFRGIMTKPVMMLDVMYRHQQHEWLVWTDDDVYINPGWLYLPLDVFLADVPEHKVMVMANYRSAFTNVLFIRNNAQGRRLMMDWIAIVMSGYIQCHGYDQAALAALIAQRISHDDRYMSFKPLNYTCLYTKADNLVNR